MSEYYDGAMEKPGEACGVFGIYAPELPVAELTYLGLQNLQHRGQEGAGISVSNGSSLQMLKEFGLIKEAFGGGRDLDYLPSDGLIATGHTRYGTSHMTGDKDKEKNYAALQPLWYPNPENPDDEFVFSTNGHIEDLEPLAASYGVIGQGASDSETVKDIIGAALQKNGDLTSALTEVLPRLKGAHSSVISTHDTLIASRDLHGMRPLHLGEIKGHGWVVASELAALKIVGAQPKREIEPGEIVIIEGIDENAVRSIKYAEADPKLCEFEFIYFSRPDNKMYNQLVMDSRESAGRQLAERDTVEADVVIAVPESGRIAAMAYSQTRGIILREGLIRNIYVDRSFIAPTQNERGQKVRNKLNPVPEVVEGKRVVVFDDSIVRSTTSEVVITMLKEAGAREVHLRIASPPYKWPCRYGMDTGNVKELIASRMMPEEIAHHIGADSIMYLTLEEQKRSLGSAAGKVCTACTTGLYPVEAPVLIQKRRLTAIQVA